ncbi:NAD(P)/FAD-dependent oxidoreductase [Alcanivorax sp. 24]|uniref:NAD(P)/FAD-dependent oxidoreductase n=1 Tax=Alcanivorax sp. 24 TaxID=2545266 RepID=UPI001F0F7868|nr:FAD-dependent oxidoreductase [Alcanivorax sp. 24]
MSQRIAIVGGGIAGLTAAWYLGARHQVTVFEAEAQLGGHTYTVDVRREHGDYAVDMGFIVFNDRTYPNFESLLTLLGVGRQPTRMGFAVSDARTGLEYCGDGLSGFFAQRANLARPRHWRLLRDILRFNRDAPALLTEPGGEQPLGMFLREGGYSDAFRRHYILPMGGAIWSCSLAQMEAFPARFFVGFFQHHGLLTLRDRPQWYVIPGGSRGYCAGVAFNLSGALGYRARGDLGAPRCRWCESDAGGGRKAAPFRSGDPGMSQRPGFGNTGGRGPAGKRVSGGVALSVQ